MDEFTKGLGTKLMLLLWHEAADSLQQCRKARSDVIARAVDGLRSDSFEHEPELAEIVQEFVSWFRGAPARLRLPSCDGRSLPGRTPAIPPGRFCLPNWNVGHRIVRLVCGCGSFFAKRHRLMKSSNHRPGVDAGMALQSPIGLRRPGTTQAERWP